MAIRANTWAKYGSLTERRKKQKNSHKGCQEAKGPRLPFRGPKRGPRHVRPVARTGRGHLVGAKARGESREAVGSLTRRGVLAGSLILLVFVLIFVLARKSPMAFQLIPVGASGEREICLSLFQKEKCSHPKGSVCEIAQENFGVWLLGVLVAWLAGWLVGRLAGGLIGWLAGWLIWLVGATSLKVSSSC